MGKNLSSLLLCIAVKILAINCCLATSCERTYSESSGDISFPLYPFKYPNNTKCKYEITVSHGQMIFIYRPYYYSSYGDSLNIYERIGATGEEIVTNLLNDAKMTYWSIGKNITLVFQSDNSNVITGLKMHYTATNGFCSKYKPCRNNASCTNIGDSNYTCSCSDDFSGRNCSVKIVPCKSNPCMNNGTCTDLYGHGKPMFNCSCTDDFQGNRCQNQIECTASSKNVTLLIVLASVGSAVFAALMVCIIIKIKKRPTKKITPRDPDESTSTTFNNKAFEANCEVDKAHN
ncbi:fibropellin-1-like isoform X2 [Rhopilema esculentum]|uniref:fibropellin-1-like isoform X2 n=1 Tax=Rhopilema esculentum TaxID=499914 RepID=UPI0031E39834